MSLFGINGVNKTIIKNTVLYSGIATGAFVASKIVIVGLHKFPIDLGNCDPVLITNAYLSDTTQTKLLNILPAINTCIIISASIFGVSAVINIFDFDN